MTYNGFAPEHDVDPVVNTDDLPKTPVPVTKEFESLGSSDIPSSAGEQIWRVSGILLVTVMARRSIFNVFHLSINDYKT